MDKAEIEKILDTFLKTFENQLSKNIEIFKEQIKEHIDLKFKYQDEKIQNVLDNQEENESSIYVLKDQQKDTNHKIDLINRDIVENNTRITKLEKFKEDVQASFESFKNEIKYDIQTQVQKVLDVVKKKKLTPAFVIATLCASPVLVIIATAIFKKLGWL